MECDESEGESEVPQSHMTLCDSMDCSLPGSSIYGILQVRILEWVAISFSRRSSQSRDWTQVSHIIGRWFTIRATKEGMECDELILNIPSNSMILWFPLSCFTYAIDLVDEIFHFS